MNMINLLCKKMRENNYNYMCVDKIARLYIYILKTYVILYNLI